MEQIIIIGLLTLNFAGLITLVVICLVMFKFSRAIDEERAAIVAAIMALSPLMQALTKALEEGKNVEHIAVVMPQTGEVVAILDVDVLSGGSLKFTLEDGDKAVFDLDGKSVFSKIPGDELIATFQKKLRV